MQFLLILSLIIAIVAVIFAVLNTEPVTVSLIAWNPTAPLAAVLLLAMLAGVLVGTFAAMPSMIKKRFTIRSQNKKMLELESEVNEQKGKITELEKQLQVQTNQAGQSGGTDQQDGVPEKPAADQEPVPEFLGISESKDDKQI